MVICLESPSEWTHSVPVYSSCGDLCLHQIIRITASLICDHDPDRGVPPAAAASPSSVLRQPFEALSKEKGELLLRLRRREEQRDVTF